MSTNDDALGGRLPLLRPDRLDAAQRDLYATLDADLIPWAKKSAFTAATADGRVVGPFNPLLYSPRLGRAFVEYLAAERQHTSLKPREREVVILTVGAAWRSAYELYAHAAVAAKAGLDQATVDALAAGGTPGGLTGNELLAHRFTRQLVVDHKVDPTLYRQAADAFGDKGLVDLTHLASLYLGTCALLNAFDVPVPE